MSGLLDTYGSCATIPVVQHVFLPKKNPSASSHQLYIGSSSFTSSSVSHQSLLHSSSTESQIFQLLLFQEVPSCCFIPPYKRSKKTMRPNKRPDLSVPLPNRNVALPAPCPPPPTSLPLPPFPSSTDMSASKILSELEHVYRIGVGAGGTVYKVIHRPTSRVFALRVIHGKHDENVRRQISREMDILRSVDHPNVVKFHGMFDLQDELHLLVEFMDVGSLEGELRQEHELADISRQILSGLAYLHSRKIVHRDIKPSNLLMNSANKVKIADFGVSRILAQISVGTLDYMSPERVETYMCDGLNDDGFAGDIWSLGVSILELYLGRFPFPVSKEDDVTSLLWAIVMPEPPEPPATASQEFHHFISCCLQKDPPKRWSAKQLLQHPFILKSTSGSSSSQAS